MVKCAECQIPMQETFQDIIVEINKTIVVPLRDVKLMKCPKCAFSMIEVKHEFVTDKKLEIHLEQK